MEVNLGNNEKGEVTKDNIKDYYARINSFVDFYVQENKIKPSKLKSSLKGDKLEAFKKKNELDGIKGIDKVIRDVIDDRIHMEKDGVLTFEKFKIFENWFIGSPQKTDISSVLDDLDECDIEYEKAVADVCNTSLGHVEKVDNNKYKVSDFDEKIIFIYDEEDFEKIKESLFNYTFAKINSKKWTLKDDQLGDIITLNINLDKEDYKVQFNAKYDEDGVKDIISKLTTSSFYKKVGKFYTFTAE